MSSNFNNAKIINVYYTKGDRKPYDVNGKPIAYIGEEFIGANEATELRFHFGEELDSASAIIVAKRANGDTRLDPLELVGTGVNSYFKVTLNAWYAEYKGKMTIIFKVYNGTVTYDDPETPTQIVSTTGQIIVSDIFNLEVAYAPNASSLVPPFETEDYDDWFFTLSTKLDKAQSITVVGALPTLTGGVYDDRYFYVEDEGVGRLYYINGSTAIECVFGLGQLNFAITGMPTATLTAGQMRYNDTTGSLDLGLKGDHILKVGETVVKRVRNDEAVSLKVGQMVYVSGSVGNSGLLLVKKADNTGEATSSKTFGMVATAMNTTSTKDGYVYIYGLLQGIDLTDTDISESVFSSGDVGAGLWLGENGKITKTLPTADNKHSVFIGYLDSYGGAGSNCSIYVKIQNGYELNELHNVRFATLANNDVLRYNATRGVWVNSTTLTTAEANISNLQGRMTTEEANVDNLQSRMTTAESNIINIEDGTTAVGRAIADENGDDIPSTYLKQVNASATYIPLSQKGANNGVVPLNSNGKISSQYLSGEQDDYIEFADLASFPLVGEADIIYCAIDTGLIYRWTGSTYAVISPSLALGTTATTAYRGDLGQNAYDNANTALDNTENIIDGTQTLSNTKFTGNIGIGTSTPSQTLEIQSLNQATTNNGNALINTSDAVGINVGGMLGLGGRFAPSAFTSFGTISGRKDTATAGESAGYLAFATRGTSALAERMRITSTGNVGIGTDSPVTTLSLVTSSSADGGLQIRRNSTSSNEYARLAFLVSTSNQNGSTAEIRALRTNRAVSGDTDLRFATNSNGILAEKMTIRDDGNVGIGTTAPAVKLHVVGGTRITGVLNVFGDLETKRLSLDYDDSLDVASIFAIQDGVSYKNIALQQAGGNVGIGTTSPATKLDVNGVINTNNNISWANGNADINGQDANLKFRTWTGSALTEKMRITSAGNVGIGTSSPTTQLHIRSGVGNLVGTSGSLLLSTDDSGTDVTGTRGVGITFTQRWQNASGSIRVGGIFGVKTEGTGNYGGGLSFYSQPQADVDMVERMRILSTGLVGVGELTPTAQLQVKSGATTRVPLIVDTLASHTADLQQWKINNTNISRVDSTGYFAGVGMYHITSANNALIVTDSSGTTIRRNIADTNPALIVNLANASATGNIQVWQKAGSALAFVDNNGSLRSNNLANIVSANNSTVNTSTTGTLISRNINDANVTLKVRQYNVSASGNLQEWIQGSTVVAYTDNAGDFYNFTGTYGTISDLRVKENIIDARDYTEDLMKLRVVKYSLKKDQEQEATKLGFIAQEVEQVFPNMVETTETEEIKDLKSIKMSVLIPMLVKTIQELNKRIEELEKK